MKRIIVLVAILVMIFTLNTYALSDIIGGADSFLSQPSVDQQPLADMIKGLTNIGLVIGTIVAIGAGIIIGIKFMTEGANGRAELKAALTPYIIGVAILFGAYGIWVIVINVFTGIFN